MLRRLIAFVVAVLLASVLAVAASTQFVLAELAAVGVEFSMADRLAMTGHDILGMGVTYLPIMAVALLIGFVVAALVIRYLLPGWQRVGYTLAGFVAVLAILGLMLAVFGLMPIAGARSLSGMLAQGLAGAVAGYLFARLLDAKPVTGAGTTA